MVKFLPERVKILISTKNSAQRYSCDRSHVPKLHTTRVYLCASSYVSRLIPPVFTIWEYQLRCWL